jgi:hypothetical protein
MAQLRSAGTAVTLPTAPVAATLGAALAFHVPWLGIAGAPVITGVVIILWMIGSDAFCSWSEEIIQSRIWFRDG